jgi:hypothetical protein
MQSVGVAVLVVEAMVEEDVCGLMLSFMLAQVVDLLALKDLSQLKGL